MRVDLKSIILGIVIGLVLFMLLKEVRESNYRSNRYQIIMSNGAASPFGSFCLDSKTGKMYWFTSDKNWEECSIQSSENSN